MSADTMPASPSGEAARQAAATHPRFFDIALLFAASVVCAALLGPWIVAYHPRPFAADFHHLWVAGRLWASLETPYGELNEAVFAEYGLAHRFVAAAPFFYPPHSVVLFAPLGLMDPGAASAAFAAVSAGALAQSSLLAADMLRDEGVRGSRLRLAALHALAVGAGWNAGVFVFQHLMTTPIVYLGVMLALRGTQKSRACMLAVGLFLALVSPQISLPLALSLLLFRRTRGAALSAGAAVAVFSVVGLAPDGVATSLGRFLHNVAVYASFPENGNLNQSGLGFFVEATTGIALRAPVLLAAALATLAVLRWRVAREVDAFRFACLALVTGLFFLSSLNHYYVVLTAAATLAILTDRSRVRRVCAALGLLLLMRSWDILALLSRLTWFEGRRNAATVDSIAIALIFAAALAAALSQREGSPQSRAAL